LTIDAVKFSNAIQKADKRTLDDKVNHSLFDTKTNNISRMMKKILNKMGAKVSFYNSRYFDMHSLPYLANLSSNFLFSYALL
jgi:hypothetical protein